MLFLLVLYGTEWFERYLENPLLVNSPSLPPVNFPDQIPPNLTLTLTLTQVGIHRGEIDQGGIFRTSFEHIRLPPENVVMTTTDMYGKNSQRSGYMRLRVTFYCFLILLS